MKIFKHRFPILLLLAGMGLASTAEASLIARLGGLAVYDTGLNITWLANANLVGTTMDWTAANTWAAGLDVGGYTGWRLPTADPACGQNYNCINSELGHLYYTELGVTAVNNITSSTSPYLALFTNVQDSFYWSGTEYAPNPNIAWYFNTATGGQNIFTKDFILHAWAVRSGDVAAVPEPGVIGLFGVGALAWAGTKARRRG